MQVLNSIAELDEKLAECDRAAEISDDAMRNVFAGFRMAPPADLPCEPLSEEYSRYQLSLYQKLAGKSYQVENEATVFDVEAAVRRPFPYCTGGLATTADQYSAIGALLRRLEVKPGARILEFGPGWGNTTLALALLGFQVTAVDIEPRFCELVERRAALHGVTVDVVNADFTWAEQVSEPFEAAIFFECFHHSTDHRQLLRTLRSALIPDGRVLFGGEPISSDFPMPWGLRMDGQSLWSIRKHGWFELGFNEAYFIDALASEGWLATKFPSGDTPVADVWVARRLVGNRLELSALDPRIIVPAGMRGERGIRLEGLSNCWGFFGPYATLPAGNWTVRVHLNPAGPRQGAGNLDICVDRGQTVLATQAVNLERLTANQGYLEISATLTRTTKDLEVRFHCDRNVSMWMQSIEFIAATPT
jgi:SAM-dependent methyltransferase